MSKRTGGKPSLKAKKVAWKIKRAERSKARVVGYIKSKTRSKYTPHQGKQEIERRLSKGIQP